MKLGQARWLVILLLVAGASAAGLNEDCNANTDCESTTDVDLCCGGDFSTDTQSVCVISNPKTEEGRNLAKKQLETKKRWLCNDSKDVATYEKQKFFYKSLTLSDGMLVSLKEVDETVPEEGSGKKVDSKERDFDLALSSFSEILLFSNACLTGTAYNRCTNKTPYSLFNPNQEENPEQEG